MLIIYAFADREKYCYFVVAAVLAGMLIGWNVAPVYAERQVSRLTYLTSLNRNNFGAITCTLAGGVTVGGVALATLSVYVPFLHRGESLGSREKNDGSDRGH